MAKQDDDKMLDESISAQWDRSEWNLTVIIEPMTT
jgi:hypothetical protein